MSKQPKTGNVWLLTSCSLILHDVNLSLQAVPHSLWAKVDDKSDREAPESTMAVISNCMMTNRTNGNIEHSLNFDRTAEFSDAKP